MRLILTIAVFVFLLGIMSACPDKCNCTTSTDRTIVNCYGKGLDSIPANIPVDAYELDLSWNKLTSIESGAFTGLENLNSLWLYRNQITSIHNGSFDGLTNLHELYLDLNKLTLIESGVFTGLKNLYTLLLSSNKITSIPSNTFNGLHNLHILSLSWNQIASIHNGSFEGLMNLHELDLSRNQLTSIESGTFAGLENLNSLFLYMNKITSIPSNAFNGLKNLHTLFLYLNNITSIPSNAFNGLKNLHTLVLFANQITFIHNGSFDGLTNLRELSLSYNKITSIPSNTFNGLQNLHTLTLSDNQITSINSSTFNGLQNLQTLDLSSNLLTSIESGILTGLENLTSLMLDNNKLSVIEVSNMDDLQYVGVDGNNLKCDCRIWSFYSWLSTKYKKSLTGANCNYNGTLILNLPMEIMSKCQPYTTTSPTFPDRTVSTANTSYEVFFYVPISLLIIAIFVIVYTRRKDLIGCCRKNVYEENSPENEETHYEQFPMEFIVPSTNTNDDGYLEPESDYYTVDEVAYHAYDNKCSEETYSQYDASEHITDDETVSPPSITVDTNTRRDVHDYLELE